MNLNAQAIYKETIQQLVEIYGEAEAASIVNLLFEDYLQISKTQRLTNPELILDKEQQENLKSACTKLLQHQPVQQIIGHCFFYGQKFTVNEHTLIPRPETEELVHMILSDNKDKKCKILDIGTGTGCIAISLATALPGAEVHAWDISERALDVAKGNAATNKVLVHFRRENVLTYNENAKFDIIVSNPPYIPLSEKFSMAKNVTDYEPEAALFVPSNDPLVFYRKIAELGNTNLVPGGLVYFEIHEDFGKEIKALLEVWGYRSVFISKDLQGKDRIAKAYRNDR